MKHNIQKVKRSVFISLILSLVIGAINSFIFFDYFSGSLIGMAFAFFFQLIVFSLIVFGMVAFVIYYWYRWLMNQSVEDIFEINTEKDSQDETKDYDWKERTNKLSFDTESNTDDFEDVDWRSKDE